VRIIGSRRSLGNVPCPDGYVQNASSVIADAKRMGVTVEADAAIGPEDLRGKPYLSCNIPSAILKELEQNGVELTFTVDAAS
jgi:hypothetical protein